VETSTGKDVQVMSKQAGDGEQLKCLAP